MTAFETFVKDEKRAALEKGAFNASERIEKFKCVVQGFYKKVETEWLKPFIDKGDITINRFPVTIFEERLGGYQIDAETFSIGGKRFQLTPIGTILIGTDARIDITFGSKSLMIIRKGRIWNQVVPDQKIRLIPLDAESFQRMIMELAK